MYLGSYKCIRSASLLYLWCYTGYSRKDTVNSPIKFSFIFIFTLLDDNNFFF
jgi:hypothetical protein